MRTTEFRDLLVKHLNDNPMPGQEYDVSVIDGEPLTIGIETDSNQRFFMTIEEEG